MLSPAFSPMTTMQWASMPSDTNGVESLNKCSIDHSKKSKTLEARLEFTYRQDKKTTLEHLYAYSGLPLSFQCKTTDLAGSEHLNRTKPDLKGFLVPKLMKMTLD